MHCEAILTVERTVLVRSLESLIGVYLRNVLFPTGHGILLRPLVDWILHVVIHVCFIASLHSCEGSTG